MNQDHQRWTDFLFEVGTLRRLTRIHRQLLLTDDVTDNIASHSYRVTIIGWLIAKMEGVDPYKVVMMCLLHDLAEIRTGDHNYLHKRYTTIHDDEVTKEQLGTLPATELYELANEFEERTSKESLIAKDADLLDQVLLLREYEWQGNKEASIWLRGKGNDTSNVQIRNLKTESAKSLATVILDKNPSDWWNTLWTSQNR